MTARLGTTDVEYSRTVIIEIIRAAALEDDIEGVQELVERAIDETTDYIVEWLKERGDVELSNILDGLHHDEEIEDYDGPRPF